MLGIRSGRYEVVPAYQGRYNECWNGRKPFLPRTARPAQRPDAVDCFGEVIVGGVGELYQSLQ